ncbi:MAG: VanW family protein [Armatimonadetes bacterium]|nr:VanW family protein [Armatimonadota bacterium]
MKRADRWLLAALYLSLAAVMGWAATHREREVVLSRFVTSLRGRTPNQVHNVALAARSINGRWIRPGEVFSFNRAVGPWTRDAGYQRAPVSYDGEVVPSWGGGVCQASTTLYNAALLAGLAVVERHRHQWIPKYVAPGRDAAVAYSNIDLRLRNDFPWPVRLGGEVRGQLVEFRVVAPERPPGRFEIRQRVAMVAPPAVVRQPWREGLPARRVRNPGRPGGRVLTYRVRLQEGREVARELLSDDTYPAMNRLLLADGDGQGGLN